MSDPIDELIELLDKAIKHHEAELESDTVKASDTLYQHYYGIRGGLQLARNLARHCKKKKAEAESRLNQIIGAFALLNTNADSLFNRIWEDLDCGLIQEARGHLDFVDEILKSIKPQ